MSRILFVISTLNTGGAQRIFSNIITRLPEEVEVDILLNDSETIVYPYRGTIIDLGMPREKNKEKITYQIKAFFQRFSLLRKLKKKNHYAACVSAMDSANIVNVLTGNKYCKTILTIHGFHPSGWIDRKVEHIVDFLMKVCYRKADAIVPVSKALAEEMHIKYHVPDEKICTIYNGYNVKDIRKESRQEETPSLPWGEDCDVIVTAGRVEKIKGQWHLIKAFSLVAKENPRARLVILGDGNIRSGLEKLIDLYNLRDKVFMPGFVKNPYAFFAKARMFVLSSLSEGYSNAIAEAMICGLPCVSADCIAGPREILQGNNKTRLTDTYEMTRYGILTPAFELDDLWDNRKIGPQEKIMAEAMEKLLNDETYYQELQNHIAEKIDDFSMENIITQWVEICLA